MPWAAAGGGPWVAGIYSPWPPNIPLPPSPVASGAGGDQWTPEELKKPAPPAPRYYGPIVCDFKAIAKRRKELGL